MGPEETVKHEVVATETCQDAMKHPKRGYNSEARMQCQDKIVEHGVGPSYLIVEYVAPETQDPKSAHIAAACKSGNLNACTINVVPKSPEAERGK